MNRIYRLLVSISAAACVTVTGCSGSSPRFTSGNNGKAVSVPRFTDETPAELKVERKELTAEDDRSVSPDKMREEIGRMERENPSAARSRLMSAIMSYMGTPYEIGGDTHAGMDCSGFSMVIFKSVYDIALPHSALEQSSLGERVSENNLRPGDLVFFRTVGTRISHVGIYVGNNLFANASVSHGVTISSLESRYYKRRYAGARRITSTDISNGNQ